MDETTHWHAGYNMVGYLPEMDPSYPFEDFEHAKRDMIGRLDNDGDFAFEYEGEEGKDRADALSALMEDLNLDSGPEWGTIVGNISYWIVTCDEDECAENGEDY